MTSLVHQGLFSLKGNFPVLSLIVSSYRANNRHQIRPKTRPLLDTADGARGLAYLSLTLSLLLPCDVLVVSSRRESSSPSTTSLSFYKCNKYLSTKIAHLSDHKWGWALRWSPDVRAEDFVFIQHMGRPVIKKVCAKQQSSHRANSSTRGVDGGFLGLRLASSPHHNSHIIGYYKLHADMCLRGDVFLDD